MDKKQRILSEEYFMFKKMFASFRLRKSIVTLLFILSALFTTLPQFVLSDSYNFLTGNLATLTNLHYLTLPVFSHSPGILIPHLLTNVLVFVIFGAMTEALIGTQRFALVTLVTFVTSLTLSYLRGGLFHGISGVCWGYQIFGIFVLIIYWERARFDIVRDPSVWLVVLFLIFNFIGLPALEVVVQGRRFMENFGQYIHLASVVVCTPFVLIWRKQIEKNFEAVLKHQALHYASFSSLPTTLVYVLLILNIVGTLLAILSTAN